MNLYSYKIPCIKQEKNNSALALKAQYNNIPNYYYAPNFTSMKKSQFSGTDRLAVEQFKAPIEKFKTNDDFNKWADKRYQEIISKDYEGKNEETKIQRENILREWNTYLTDENREYSSGEKLIIANGITKSLKPNEATIPPVLNKGVLADTIYNLKQELKTEQKTSFDFEKRYLNNLRAYYLDDTKTEGQEAIWVKIPSKKHDPEHFEANVEKLKTLSNKSWCTKSNNAEPYLSQGDFHIYMENGQAKLGIRFSGDKIYEIQGEKNDGNIPLNYYDTFTAYLKKENLKDKLDFRAENEYNDVKIKKKKADNIKKKLENEIENKDYLSIYQYFGLQGKINRDNKITLMEYSVPNREGITLSDIGLSESELFKQVTKIQGTLDLTNNSELKSLYNVKRIGGDVILMRSHLEDFGKLEEIGGSLIFNDLWDRPERAPKVSSLKNIKEVGGELDIAISNIEDLGSLKRVGGNVLIGKSNVRTLKNLEYVGGYLDISGSKVESLGKLKEVKDNADFRHSQLEDFGDLEKVGGSVMLKGTPAKSLKNLKYVGRDLVLTNSNIEDLGGLEKVMQGIFLNAILFDKKIDLTNYYDGSDF